MNCFFPKVVLFGIFVFLLTGSGCGLKHSPRSPEEFARETLRLEERARAHEDPEVRAESRRELGALYVNPRNPRLDYGKALREFEIYLGSAPEAGKSDEVRTWVAVLRELEKEKKEASDLRDKVKALAWEREGNQQALVQLGGRNRELLASVEKLQGRVEILEKSNRSLSEANRTLSENQRSLAEANRSLKEENEKVRDTLEKLRVLDRQMEEKRRSVR
jgi:chromosome segregation ATPase